MEVLYSEALLLEQLRDNALQQVKNYPLLYLDLVDELKSDSEICLATLLAFGEGYEYDDFFPDVLEMVDQCAPDFTNHKPVLFLYMGFEDNLLQVYFERFGPRICQNRDLIDQLVEHVSFAYVFRFLPVELRSDTSLLKLAVESVPDEEFPAFLQHVPLEALVANEFILSHVQARSTIHLDENLVPSSFWSNRKFVMMWSERGERIPISLIPREFRGDSEICLSFYKNKLGRQDIEKPDNWISKSLLDDKPFVLACVSHHPKLFEYCTKKLQNDVDVLFGAAYGASCVDLFLGFVDSLDESCAVTLLETVHRRIRPHDEFTTFLACAWKSRLIPVLPLSILDCDEETNRGLATAVAQYLGFKNANAVQGPRRVWGDIVLSAIARKKYAKAVMPLVLPNELVQGVLQAIQKNRRATMRAFPNKLWTIYSFVKWAATKGKFHDAIPSVFSEDWKICFAYFKYSSAIREQVWPWMSDRVKSKRFFLLKCSSIDPLILGRCCSEAIRHDFNVLLSVVFHAAKRLELDGLIEMARDGGWADSLIMFAKSVRAKLEAQCALSSFEAEAKIGVFAHVSARRASVLTNLIGSYLGTATHRKQLDRLKEIWRCRAIFFLALGGSIDELSEANKFRSEALP